MELQQVNDDDSLSCSTLPSRSNDTKICDNEFAVDREYGRCKTFSQLPPELQFKVFEFLDQRDRFKVALVCRQWREMSRTPIFWKRLVITRTCELKSGCVFATAPLLTSVTLNVDYLHISPICCDLSRYCSQLQSLNVAFCKWILTAHIEMLTQHCLHVHDLSVEGCDGVNDGFVRAVSAWKLRKLNLCLCKQVTNDGLLHVIRHCPFLEELNVLENLQIDARAITALPKYLRGTLKALTLDGVNLTDEAYKAVSDCPNLTSLHIMYVNDMTDSGLLVLMTLKELRSLEIKCGDQLTAAGLCMLFESGNLNKLTSLSLERCTQLQDDAVEVFTKGCPHLQRLNLGWCWNVTDTGVEAIIDCCRFLIFLDLTGVVHTTATYISQIPAKLSRLRSLILEQCPSVEDSVLKEVKLSMPHLYVVDYYGSVVNCETEEDDQNDMIPIIISEHFNNFYLCDVPDGES